MKKEHLTAIFFDVEKAYDTTWTYGIIRDQCNLGLRDRQPQLIDGYLTDIAQSAEAVE